MTLSPKHAGIPWGALEKPHPSPGEFKSLGWVPISTRLQVPPGDSNMQPGLITSLSRSCSAVSVGDGSVFLALPLVCQVLVADETPAEWMMRPTLDPAQSE